tara:strand:+ start:182 stop:367 length:186 start_codon:yes stop_codon:yes gene_type:complete
MEDMLLTIHKLDLLFLVIALSYIGYEAGSHKGIKEGISKTLDYFIETGKLHVNDEENHIDD